MPSLTLADDGAERFTMRRQCPGLLDLGITPNLLVMTPGVGHPQRGLPLVLEPVLRPNSHQLYKGGRALTGNISLARLNLRVGW